MDWRIKDNNTICMNIINKHKLEHNERKFLDEAGINREVAKIMKDKKCSELDATIILKEKIKKKYKVK